MSKRLEIFKRINKGLKLLSQGNKILYDNIQKKDTPLQEVYNNYLKALQDLIDECIVSLGSAEEHDKFDEIIKRNFGKKFNEEKE